MRLLPGLIAPLVALAGGCVIDNPVFMFDPTRPGAEEASGDGTSSGAPEPTSTGAPEPTSTGAPEPTTTTTTGVSATTVTTEPTGETSSGETSSGETSSGEVSTSGPPAVCGDGVVDPDEEECDDGPDNGEDQACTPDCLNAACGDGYLLMADGTTEQCDDGAANADDAQCTSLCQLAVCGDALVLAAGDDPEACDDGPNNLWKLGHCAPDCRAVIPAEPKTIFRTDHTKGLKGNLVHPNGVVKSGGVASADEACGLLSGPGTKAMIAQGEVRRATVDPWVGGAQSIDWVFKPYTGYENAGGTLLGITGREGLLGVQNEAMLGALPMAITPGAFHSTRTGLNANWTSAGLHCNNWTSTSFLVYVTYGDSGTTDEWVNGGGMLNCGDAHPLYCVQQ